jgi:sporulation protein YlmC with PRC-barrel domain
MLRNASAIKGYVIAASDGRIGTVSDFLFDDANWKIRWLVVDTGKWLTGRKVLLPPSVLGQLDPNGSEFSIRLTMKQVKESPDIDTERPVSRQFETNIYDYYGWSPYWGKGAGYFVGGFGFGGGAMTALPISGSQRRAEDVLIAQQSDDDPHLRSIEAVTGYHIHATNGEIGHIEDFILEDSDWSVHDLVVDTKNWWPGNKVLILPRSIQKIDWMDNQINLNISREQVKSSPAYNASTTIDRALQQIVP